VKQERGMITLNKAVGDVEYATHGAHSPNTSWKANIAPDADLKTVVQKAALTILTLDVDEMERCEIALEQAGLGSVSPYT